MEKVSIIVPVYNAEKTLKRCVNSLLSQTYRPLEIILVDDGSTDDSLPLMNQLLQENPGLIRIVSQTNAGAAAARNTGLSKVTGSYLMFVDSDDSLDSACVEWIVRRSIDLNADITRFQLVHLYPDGSRKISSGHFPEDQRIEKKDFPKVIYNKMLSGIQLNSICSMMYRRSVVKDLRFRADLATAEDLAFNMQAFTNAESFTYIPRPYYYYYQSASGLTGRGISIATKYRCNLKISMLLLKYLKQWGMFQPVNMIKAFIRILRITMSKIRRSILHDV